jgi:mono/diheme cytochrome c family protein
MSLSSIRIALSLSAALLLPLTVRAADKEPDISKLPAPANKTVDFAKDIKPIFEKSCIRCHGPEKQKSKYRLDTREAALKGGKSEKEAIIPGKSEKSPLVHYVAYLVEEMEMPPVDDDKAKPLTKEQVALVRAWIDQGAKWE